MFFQSLGYLGLTASESDGQFLYSFASNILTVKYNE